MLSLPNSSKKFLCDTISRLDTLFIYIISIVIDSIHIFSIISSCEI